MSLEVHEQPVGGAALARAADAPPARVRAALRRWLARDGIALLVLVAAALAAIAPIVPAMRTRVIGWPGENIQYAYMTGRMAQALLLGQSPFADPRLNAPEGLALAATDVPYLSNLAVAPATWLLGPTFGYNLIILLSFVLSGYFVFLWARRVTGSRAGALVAGLAFLLAPYRAIHSYGHLQMVCTYALPLFFWALDSALQPAAPSWRGLALLGGATLLVGGASQYYLVIALVTGAIYALLALLPRPAYLLRHGWRLALSVAAGALVSALPYLGAFEADVYTPYNVHDTRIWSLDPLSFVLPSRLHPLWGGLVDRLHPEPLWIEKTVYIGLVAAALMSAALVWRRAGDRRSLVWLGVALAAAIFALGTDLHINNQPLSATDPLWLPSYYLARVPFLSLMRSWPRFGIVTILFVALLAGVGAARLLERARARRRLALALIVVLVCVDLLPGGLETSALGPRAVDRWLAQQPGDFRVAVLPTSDSVANYRAMFGSLFHAKQLPAYNHPTHRAAAYRDFADRAAAFPDPASVRALRGMGLRYLLLERDVFERRGLPWDALQARLAQSPGLRIVADLDGVVVVGFN